MEYTIFKYGKAFFITSLPFTSTEYLHLEQLCGNPWTTKQTVKEALEYINANS